MALISALLIAAVWTGMVPAKAATLGLAFSGASGGYRAAVLPLDESAS